MRRTFLMSASGSASSTTRSAVAPAVTVPVLSSPSARAPVRVAATSTPSRSPLAAAVGNAGGRAVARPRAPPQRGELVLHGRGPPRVHQHARPRAQRGLPLPQAGGVHEERQPALPALVARRSDERG